MPRRDSANDAAGAIMIGRLLKILAQTRFGLALAAPVAAAFVSALWARAALTDSPRQWALFAVLLVAVAIGMMLVCSYE